MSLIGEASRLIAVEINLWSNSRHKQNYIFALSVGVRAEMFVVRISSLWAERQNPICFTLAINLAVLKCLDEKFISFTHEHLMKNAGK